VVIFRLKLPRERKGVLCPKWEMPNSLIDISLLFPAFLRLIYPIPYPSCLIFPLICHLYAISGFSSVIPIVWDAWWPLLCLNYRRKVKKKLENKYIM